MTFKEIIANLESQVKDREYSADGDPESQLAKDAQVLRLVVQMLKENKGLDRSRWEWDGCSACAEECCELCVYEYSDKEDYPCSKCVTGNFELVHYKPKNYCSKCGRPLTEEAWAELERRIGGNNETIDN